MVSENPKQKKKSDKSAIMLPLTNICPLRYNEQTETNGFLFGTGGILCSHWQRQRQGMFGVAEDMARFDIFEGSLIRVLSRIGDGVIIAKDNIRLAIGGEAAERIKV